jgi:hypothetical protein
MLGYFEDSYICTLEFIRRPSVLQWPGRVGIAIPKVTLPPARALETFRKLMK